MTTDNIDKLHIYIPGNYDMEVRTLIRKQKANIPKLIDTGISLYMCDSLIDSILNPSSSLFLIPVVDSNLQIGFINKKCEIVVEPCYDSIKGAFYNPNSIVAVCKEQLWNVIDCDGKMLMDEWSKYMIVPSRDSRMITINSKAIMNVDNDKQQHYIKDVISVDGFRYGFARIHRKEGWGIINESGEEVLPATYEEVYPFYDYPKPTTIVKESKNSKEVPLMLNSLE